MILQKRLFVIATQRRCMDFNVILVVVVVVACV
jgi:hypothetical protein